MSLIQPPFLKPGDRVAIVSPARSITFEEVHPSIKIFQQWGLEVVLGIHVFGKHHQFAGTDDQRLHDFQQMLDDDSVRAIICSRGGYGTIRIADRIDWKKFRRFPKWIVGFSDITVLHALVHRHLGIQTLHAIMPYNIKASDSDSESVVSLRDALFGESFFFRKPVTFLDRPGLNEGILTGGNLSILYSLLGTPLEPETDGKVLFLEDVDEYLYHIDRMMTALRHAGKLRNLKGLITGSMKDMKDNAVQFGMNAAGIISDAVKGYSYPVCFDFPSGHDFPNLALFMGRKVKLIVDDEINMAYG